MNRKLFLTIYLLIVLPLASADEAAMREDNRQRLTAISAEIKETASSEKAVLVQGSLRINVFGPEATIAFYTLEGTNNSQQQYMVVLEKQVDTAAGEVAPALQTAHLIARQYSTRQVVVGHARIGAQGWRTVDVTRATVDEQRSAQFELLATVTLPVTGAVKPVIFRISRAYGDKLAIIVEKTD
jgi:hypothetical protein